MTNVIDNFEKTSKDEHVLAMCCRYVFNIEYDYATDTNFGEFLEDTADIEDFVEIVVKMMESALEWFETNRERPYEYADFFKVSDFLYFVFDYCYRTDDEEIVDWFEMKKDDFAIYYDRTVAVQRGE